MSLNLKPWQIWSLTGLIIIVSRLLFVSNGLWHNDAADFLRVAQQWLLSGQYVPAHAPDYPAWNFLLTLWLWLKAKLFFSWSLVTWANYLNLLLGSIACLLVGYFFWLREKNHWLAATATLLTAFNPLFWLHQQTSLSDVPAILFTVIILVILQKNLLTTNWKNYLLIIISVFALLATRLAGGLTLVPIILWLIIEQYQQPRKLLSSVGSIIVGAGLAVGLYVAINHGFNDLFAISRRVTPTWLELFYTLKVWLNGNNLLFVLLAFVGVLKLILQKNKLSWLVIGGFIIWSVYVAGWWRAGQFDVTRYALPTAIFIALAGAYGLQTIISKKYLTISFSGLIVLASVILIINNSCTTTAYLINQKGYCQLNNFHNGIDPKQQLYILAAPNLPSAATVFIPIDDWSYPKLFLQYQNSNQRQIIYFNPDDNTKTIGQINEQINNGAVIYLFEQHLTNQKLATELESDNWKIEAIDLNRSQRLIKVEKNK